MVNLQAFNNFKTYSDMKKKNLFSSLAGVAFVVFLIFLTALVTQWLWSWLVPELLPRFVEEGYIAKRISLGTAFFMGIFFNLIGFSKLK